MVQCLSEFINACYIARRNVITTLALERFQKSVSRFHELRNIFIKTGVRVDISLPRQHALSHYYQLIQLFGSPNGLYSLITESKHIKAVKEPWRRSSRFKALPQMLRSICRMEKMTALQRRLLQDGMLQDSLPAHVAANRMECRESRDHDRDEDDNDGDDNDGYITDLSADDNDHSCWTSSNKRPSDVAAVEGTPKNTQIGTSDVKLAARIGECKYCLEQSAYLIADCCRTLLFSLCPSLVTPNQPTSTPCCSFPILVPARQPRCS